MKRMTKTLTCVAMTSCTLGQSNGIPRAVANKICTTWQHTSVVKTSGRGRFKSFPWNLGNHVGLLVTGFGSKISSVDKND